MVKSGVPGFADESGGDGASAQADAMNAVAQQYEMSKVIKQWLDGGITMMLEYAFNGEESDDDTHVEVSSSCTVLSVSKSVMLTSMFKVNQQRCHRCHRNDR